MDTLGVNSTFIQYHSYYFILISMKRGYYKLVYTNPVTFKQFDWFAISGYWTLPTC